MLTPDRLEDFVQIVGDQTVPRPLGKEGEGDTDAHTPPVSWGADERLPAHIFGDCEIAL